LTIAPERRRIIPRETARHVKKTELRFVSSTVRQFVVAHARKDAVARHAGVVHQHRGRLRPRRRDARHRPGTRHQPERRGPRISSASASASSRACWKPTTTVAPARASSDAIARPIPREAPVNDRCLSLQCAKAVGLKYKRLLELVERGGGLLTGITRTLLSISLQ
jgi:hypothetical protein